jgi:hypothetical protein
VPATSPTPSVGPDHEDRYLRGGAGEAACVRDWQDSGYVALANFNQVGCVQRRFDASRLKPESMHLLMFCLSTSRSRPRARACGPAC